jgi:hypothetical protein
LAENGNKEAMEEQEQQEKKKNGSKKNKWGTVIAERRSTRIRNDGRTSLEKAKDQKRSFWRTSIRKVRPKNPAEFLNLRSLKSWLKW